MKNRSKYPYKRSRLINRDGDISKMWHIEYYVWNENTEEIQRERWYKGINTIKNKRERLLFCAALMKDIDEMLANDELIIKKKITYIKFNPNTQSFLDVIDYVLDFKIKEVSKNSYNNFIYLQRYLQKEFKALNAENMKFKDVDHVFLLKMFQNTLSSKSWSKATYNTYLKNLRTIYNFLSTNFGEIIKVNVMDKLKKMKETKGLKHKPFSLDQLAALKKHLEETEQDRLLMFVQTIFYTFVRPGELLNLKVKHIEENRLYIPPEISKNSIGDYVTIPNSLFAIYEKLNIKSYDPEFYIFSKGEKPSTVKAGKNYYYQQIKKVYELLNIPEGYTMYSFKHSGVIQLYLATKDIKKVQKQCRHHDINMTDVYLRDLGMISDDDDILGMEGF